MIEQLFDFIATTLALGSENLTLWQMGLRTVIVYIVALAMIRLGAKRFLGENAAFDAMLAIVFGSVTSRAITGSAPFFPTLFASSTLIALHQGFAWMAFRSDRFGTAIKGNPRILIKDGEILWDAMRKSNISRDDLLEALRAGSQIDDPSQVKIAHLERNGEISAIEMDKEPRILEIRVEEGVQVIRIKID